MKVFLNGKITELDDLKNDFNSLEFLSKDAAKDILNLLYSATRPQSRKDIAQQIGKSTPYVIQLLEELISVKYIVPFKIGGRKLMFYVLTEIGKKYLEQEAQKVKKEIL